MGKRIRRRTNEGKRARSTFLKFPSELTYPVHFHSPFISFDGIAQIQKVSISNHYMDGIYNIFRCGKKQITFCFPAANLRCKGYIIYRVYTIERTFPYIELGRYE